MSSNSFDGCTGFCKGAGTFRRVVRLYDGPFVDEVLLARLNGGDSFASFKVFFSITELTKEADGTVEVILLINVLSTGFVFSLIARLSI